MEENLIKIITLINIMLGLAHLLFLILLMVCAYEDFKKRRVADAFVIASWVLILVLGPTQMEFLMLVAALIVAWLIALIFPKSLSWADVMFLPALLVFCLSLFSYDIVLPVCAALILFLFVEFEKLKKSYPAFMLFLYIYAAIFVSNLLLRNGLALS